MLGLAAVPAPPGQSGGRVRQLLGLAQEWLGVCPAPDSPSSCRIYKYQAHGYAFSSLEELLHSLGGEAFINMTQRSVAESLLEAGVTQRFIDDVIAAVLRSSYGQSMLLVPAFAGEAWLAVLVLSASSSPCKDSGGRLRAHGRCCSMDALHQHRSQTCLSPGAWGFPPPEQADTLIYPLSLQGPCRWQVPRATHGLWKEATSWCVQVC